MPLVQGYSEKAIGANIAIELDNGKPRKQAEAIAYSVARQVWKRRHPGKALPEHLKVRRKNPIVKTAKSKHGETTKFINLHHEFSKQEWLSGEASEYLYLLRDKADKENKIVTANPPKNQIAKFVAYGFVKNTGKNKDYSLPMGTIVYYSPKRHRNPVKVSRPIKSGPTDHLIQAENKKTGAKYYYTGNAFSKSVYEAARWHDSAEAKKIGLEIANRKGKHKIVDTSLYQLAVISDPIKETARRGRNPVSLSKTTAAKRAADRYEDFTGHKADEYERVPFDAPDAALLVGDCDGILYTTVRDGRKEKYIHKFKRNSRPLLAASQDGRQLLLLGGAFEFTERGIEDK